MSSHENWSGRTEEVSDYLGGALLSRIATTFSQAIPVDGEPLPLLWHWCFFQKPTPEQDLGIDGHPVRGGIFPPPEGCSRMWAGGSVEFLKPLLTGKKATRASTITRVEEKAGRSGSLLFVTVRHEYTQDDQLCVIEEQDIVYRELTAPKLESPRALDDPQWREVVVPTQTLLFRYSAITFNSHRIHYDFPYATEAEGYQGLVVHGPLIATLNLRAFQRAHPDAEVRRFGYRGIRPLIALKPFDVQGRVVEPGVARVWASNGEGEAHCADIEFV